MQDLEKLGKELQRGGQAEKLRTLAASADGQRLSRMADRRALAEAAKRGDTAALQAMMNRLLSTEEGRRLSEQVRALLREKGRG